MNLEEAVNKAKIRDQSDPLAKFRERFVIDDEKVMFLDGNSLGRLPKATKSLLEDTINHQWGRDLIDSWNKDWYEKPCRIGARIAKIIGADEDEVIVADNTSMNLYKLAFAALLHQSGKKNVLIDRTNFPSDIYILQGLLEHQFKDYKLHCIGEEDDISISSDTIQNVLDDQTALVVLSHVAFKSAALFDLKQVTRMVQEYGGMVLWDLSHSVGAVPIDLRAAKVDLAVGCTYKYLNGGPGAPAFLYVKRELQELLQSPVWGWFGTQDPFEFSLEYSAENDIKKFLTGTPNVLSLAAVEPGVDMTVEAGIDRIRQKSQELTSFFIQLFESELKQLGFSLFTPENPELRGSHVSIAHKQADKIIKALMDPAIDGLRIIPDFRKPDIIRFGFAPLYNSFEEVVLTIAKLKKVVKDALCESYDSGFDNVT